MLPSTEFRKTLGRCGLFLVLVLVFFSPAVGQTPPAQKEEADKAIAGLNGKDLKGRTLTVNEARPRLDLLDLNHRTVPYNSLTRAIL